jgi:hypothetical protein
MFISLNNKQTKKFSFTPASGLSIMFFLGVFLDIPATVHRLRIPARKKPPISNWKPSLIFFTQKIYIYTLVA